MKYLKISALLLTTSLGLSAQENLDLLLEKYQDASDLSHITKKEAAGFLDIYTREDLEQMQAHNLTDVLKTISSLYVSRGANNLTLLQKPSVGNAPLSAMRLYINDHDVSSTTFGSAFLTWGDMPIEYIDHIEVYKSTSSIEFGNENAPLIIKLYTKTASRDNGAKVKLSADSLGSFGVDTYIAKELENDFSYFFYAQAGSTKREEYTHTYQNQTYDIKSDKQESNLYGMITYKGWQVELANYYKQGDSFFGRGTYKTPTDGELDNIHSYIHIKKKFDNDINLHLSFDNMVYERTYEDPNGMSITAENQRKTVDSYYIRFHDNIYSVMADKTFHVGDHRIIIGGFYKYKSSKSKGSFDDITTNEVYTNDYRNALHLSSVYIEENYMFDPTLQFVLSMKGDFYRYDKEVDNLDEFVFRVGGIKKFDDWMIKLFYTDTYIPLGFYQVYSDNNTPYKANPHLKSPDLKIFSSSIAYKAKQHHFEFLYAHSHMEDSVVYAREGITNLAGRKQYSRYELRYEYILDHNNRLDCVVFYADNSMDFEKSPDRGVNLRIFNTIGKFDIYNELLFRDSYSVTNIYSSDETIDLGRSYDYTLAVKYHYSKDLSFGVRGENLLDDSYSIYYNNAYDVQVYDRKVWFEMGYLF